MAKLFVSYSHEDGEFVSGLQQILDECKIDYFLDRKGIEWGDSFPEVIADNLRRATALVVVLSPASMESQWVSYEVGQASALNKRVLPLLFHPRQRLPGFLLHTHHLSSLAEARKFFEDEGIKELGPPQEDPENAKDRYNLIGDWHSTYEDYEVATPTHIWRKEIIEVMRVGRLLYRAGNRENPADDRYTATMQFIEERFLTGSWESRMPGGHASGAAQLILAPRGDILYGMFTGPKENGEIRFFRWVLARRESELEKGKILLAQSLNSLA